MTLVVDDMVIFSAPFGSFEPEDANDFEYKQGKAKAEFDFNKLKGKVYKKGKLDVFNPSNGLTVELSIGAATVVETVPLSRHGKKTYSYVRADLRHDKHDDNDDNHGQDKANGLRLEQGLSAHEWQRAGLPRPFFIGYL